MIDVDSLRAATPGCTQITHFNNASCTLPSHETLAVIKAHLDREAFEGPSEAGVAVAADIQQTRVAAATLLGADASEIALTGSGSQGWGLAFAAMPPLGAGDRVLVGMHEWGGNLSTLARAAERAGASVEIVPNDEQGAFSVEALSAMLDERVRLVALTWCPATNGVVNDAAAVGAITRAAGIPFFVDAGQAIGQLPVDVEAIGCDVLKGAGRKALRGPRGTALLYVRKSFLSRLEPPYLDVVSAPYGPDGATLRDDARRFETGENPFALQLALGVAIRATLKLGVPAIRERIDRQASTLRAVLAGLPGVTVHDAGPVRSSIVSFTVEGHTPASVRDRLAADAITVGAIAEAYTPFDMRARQLPAIVRASVSYLTTDAEIDRLASAVNQISRGR
ncbi:aminotransferase class V-fold PLP-dependent enzyme [Phreatobacter oligotrophus]|jgi:selenocysteine lyase/cysteine desulfurase|uniref:Selenocysteine lyase/cysteine desulfurase n=1 Tax=Phreatobacter oligotrophus TaxID=1122261 RepID=A0A2T4YYU4_9HYPH|nr:aminotransferase class V-fold PLP-dependent enzyme [Phreatobacter oligotrophus]PTM51882.1 selenocysteine lyase/cysteine desulfurase [Phreatobacter oligotrophus]